MEASSRNEKISVAVLFGGCSTEYDVSLQSASAVIKYLDRSKYEPVLIGITKKGVWYRYFGEVSEILSDTWQEDQRCQKAVLLPDRTSRSLLCFGGSGAMETVPIDVAFPVLHGKNGEDGTVQGVFELAGIPVVGCGILSSAVCMDKDMAHRVVAEAGVPVPKSIVLLGETGQDALAELTKDFKFPVYIKPARAGSSIGITKAKRVDELVQGVEIAFEHDDKVIIEEGIEGFEVGVAVIGNDELVCGEVDEIELFCDLFDYHEKYTQKYTTIHMPARLSDEVREEIKRAAVVAYKALGCKGLSRVDLFYTPEGKIVFNEANTLPGMTAKSRFPNMLKAVGITYEQLVDRLIDLAMQGDDFRRTTTGGCKRTEGPPLKEK